MLHDAELADAVIDMDHCITQRICRKMPLIVVPAVALIDHTHMIGLDDAEIFKGTAARNYMRLIALRQLHRHAKRNQGKITLFQHHLTRRTQVDPVRFAVNVGEAVNGVCEIFDLNPYKLCSHGSVLIGICGGGALVQELHNAGYEAAVIGQTNAGNDRLLYSGGNARYLERPAEDELYKVCKKQKK